MPIKDIPPRVTNSMVENAIREEYYFTAANGVTETIRREAESAGRPVEAYNFDAAILKHTFCVLVLHNGFTISGENAHVNLVDHDPAMARKMAREKAIAKVYELLGFHLSTMRKNQRSAATGEDPFDPIPC